MEEQIRGRGRGSKIKDEGKWHGARNEEGRVACGRYIVGVRVKKKMKGREG